MAGTAKRREAAKRGGVAGAELLAWKPVARTQEIVRANRRAGKLWLVAGAAGGGKLRNASSNN